MSDAYKKAYERERLARFAAEKILDEKTREVQSSIEMIQYQFNDLMQQKKESDYLLSVASLTKKADDFSLVVEGFLLASIEYLGVSMGRYSFLKNRSLKVSDVYGYGKGVGHLNSENYKSIYGLRRKNIIAINELKNSDLEAKLQDIGVDRIVFIPISCFGKVTTVCEIFLPKDAFIKEEILEQCEVSSYQISNILEGNENKKKLEKSYIEIKSSHEKIKYAQSQLVQSEKMASLGQLSAGIAHEINNPIGFVVSNIGTLKEYMGAISNYIMLSNKLVSASESDISNKMRAIDEEENFSFIIDDINEIISDCDSGLFRIKEIVANLKSFSRLDEEEKLLFNINECIENIIKVVWNELKYKVDLKRNFSYEIPMIRGHEGQIGQVIMNMLVNASHAIETQGEVFVETRQEDNLVKIIITDTGSGISDEHKSKIFDPFFTTKAVDEGTGLGLSVSYGIIESHGGEIKVRSKVGEGTCFEISLPAEKHDN